MKKILSSLFLTFFLYNFSFSKSNPSINCVPTDIQFALDPIGIDKIDFDKLKYILEDKISFERLKKEIGIPDRIYKKRDMLLDSGYTVREWVVQVTIVKVKSQLPIL